jgi:hypothetical protein
VLDKHVHSRINAVMETCRRHRAVQKGQIGRANQDVNIARGTSSGVVNLRHPGSYSRATDYRKRNFGVLQYSHRLSQSLEGTLTRDQADAACQSVIDRCRKDHGAVLCG